ncbi:MAG: TlyA family RNA methyltransferase, partial [Clostridia bacterium]|nr:TlyA family RNA methyltransferase [Clostridia bacterium]
MATRIDVYLAEHGYCKSRSQAAVAISEGRVLIGGVPVTKASFSVEDGVLVEVIEKD